MATAAELRTILSVRDVYDMLEVLTIDGHNRRLIAKWQKTNGDNN